MSKNYVFCEFDGSVGCEEWFDTKEKALEYANYSWNHTTEKEKAKLEWSFVIETEKTKEEVEDLPGWVGDYATATIWEKGLLSELSEEEKEEIIEEAVDFLLVTEAGLTEDRAKMYRKYISSHANDYIKNKYEGLSEDIYEELIEETVTSLADYFDEE